MDDGKLVDLALQISTDLPEVTRNEWVKWAQLVQRYDIDKALAWADKMGQDITLRPGVKRSNQAIARVMRNYSRRIQQMEASHRDRLFGYVAWCLAVSTSRGSLTPPGNSPVSTHRRR